MGGGGIHEIMVTTKKVPVRVNGFLRIGQDDKLINLERDVTLIYDHGSTILSCNCQTNKHTTDY